MEVGLDHRTVQSGRTGCEDPGVYGSSQSGEDRNGQEPLLGERDNDQGMDMHDGLQDHGVRLFLSVDIAGSTQFKSSLPSVECDQSENESSWVTVYTEFFDDFPALFVQTVNETRSSERHATQGVDVELWKTLGDELVFVALVKSEADAGLVLLAFHKTISGYQEKIHAKHNLHLKATAWTAGFPIRNRRVVVKMPRGKQVEDFIGPDMDIGFRLSKVARPGPIVASMDLVDLLIGREYQSKFHCVFVGWEILKGVFMDKPYPVHWLVHKDHEILLPPWEDAICQFSAGYSRWKSRKECIDDTKKRIEDVRESLNKGTRLGLFPPYLDKKKMPAEHARIHERLKSRWRGEMLSEKELGEDAKDTKTEG